MKDFDSWNKQKKVINVRAEKLYSERDIWWCSLGTNVGFEQDGTGSDFERPVLILKGFSKHVCLIVPLTTSLKPNPYHIDLGTVGNRNAFAIISQVKLIDTRRLIDKIQMLDKCTFDSVKKAVKALL
jgi:mRNA interferase MazF